MRTGNELDRLTGARPRITEQTRTVLDAADEEHMLRQILTVPRAPRLARGRALGLGHPSRAGLLASGLAVTAVSVSAAVVLAAGSPAVPGGAPAGGPNPAPGKHLSPGETPAQEVLLAAASAAAANPAGHGAYWYVKETWTQQGTQSIQKTWNRRYTNEQWVWAGKKTNNHVMHYPIQAGYWLGGNPMELRQLEELPPVMISPQRAKHLRSTIGPRSGMPSPLTFGQLQKLPADPAALKARIAAFNARVAAAGRGNVRWAVEPYSPSAAMFMSLVALVAELPVPAQVRAAAYRVLATLPDVTSLGRVDGGQGLRFGLGGNRSATLIIDPSTSQLRETLRVVGVGGEVSSDAIAAQWTNNLPS